MPIILGLLPVLILLLMFAFTITIHEYSHGWVADRLGDPTAKIKGRLSLNPLSHYDLIGSTLLLLGLFGFGPVVGWAKPVPIDPFNFRNPRRDSGMVALAGPVSNLIIAILVSLVIRFFPFFVLNSLLIKFVVLNIGLAVFNLLPIGPLDGFKVVLGFLPPELAYDWEKSQSAGMLLLIFLLFFPLPFFSLSSILSGLIGLVLRLFLGSSFTSII